MRDWSNWPKEYYETTEREERLAILKERLESEEADEKDRIRMKFWNCVMHSVKKCRKGWIILFVPG